MKNIKLNKAIIFLFSLTILIACEDPYDIDVDAGESQLVVDAFIKNNAKTKTIKLSKTVEFFEAAQAPAATGANVGIVNVSKNELFTFTENPIKAGEYQWISLDTAVDSPFGSVGDTLNLFIRYQKDTFTSFSVIKRTTPIDSVVFIFEEESAFFDGGYIAEFKAIDQPGIGDVYWIRTWINGIYLSKAAEINVAYDALFSPGGTNSDGIPFILPIRQGINPVEDDEDEVRNDPNQYLPKIPYEVGDSIYIEIWSINESTLFFLQQIQTEVNNGGLFATPPTNVRSNVFNISPDKSAAVGHFCVSEVSTGGARLKQ
jgi:hypothetical protein